MDRISNKRSDIGSDTLQAKQLRGGDDILDHVDLGIRLWDKVLLCCSKNSLGSGWVEAEIDKALEKEQALRKQR